MYAVLQEEIYNTPYNGCYVRFEPTNDIVSINVIYTLQAKHAYLRTHIELEVFS